MKRIIRIVWISALTGLAFLVACSCHNKMSKQEKKELQNRRSAIVERLDQFQTKDYAIWEASLLDPNSDIDLGDRMDGLKALSQNNQEEIDLRKQLHEIDSLLNDTAAMKQNEQSLSKAMSKQRFIIQSIENAIPPCVYGPPEVMGGKWQDIEEPIEPVEEEPINEEEPVNEQKPQRDSINRASSRDPRACVYGPPPTRQKDRMTKQEKAEKIEQLQHEQDSIGRILQRREGACVYGSPEVIQRYNRETDRLRSEYKRIHDELFRLKNGK